MKLPTTLTDLRDIQPELDQLRLSLVKLDQLIKVGPSMSDLAIGQFFIARSEAYRAFAGADCQTLRECLGATKIHLKALERISRFGMSASLGDVIEGLTITATKLESVIHETQD